MSRISLSPNASGTGTLTIAAPNTNADRTLTLPDATTTLVGTDATQTLMNKTFSGGTVTGATISNSTVQGGAITRGTAVASTSGTFIDFTGIPSWAKRVTVMFSGVSTNGTSPPQIQLGAGSMTTSGYLGANTTTAGGVATSNFSAGFGIGVSTAQWFSTAIAHGEITISSLGGNTWVCSGSVASSSSAQMYFTAGSVSISGTLDRVRITTVNGTDTFDAGTINIMWEG